MVATFDKWVYLNKEVVDAQANTGTERKIVVDF